VSQRLENFCFEAAKAFLQGMLPVSKEDF
jgi:hypothetical protein